MIFRLIPGKIHGILDYLVVLLFLFAPKIFGFADVYYAAKACYVLAMIHLALTLLTDFPMGVFRKLSFSVHGYLEIVVGFLLLGVPTLLGFNGEHNARLFFIAAGVVMEFVVALTRYDRGFAPGEHKITST